MTTTILPTRNKPGASSAPCRQRAAPTRCRGMEIAASARSPATEASAEAVREFLDSRHGRHFADDVASELTKAGPDRSRRRSRPRSPAGMGWRIGRRTSRDEGIPVGLPYLTGWVLTSGSSTDEGLTPPPFAARRAPAGRAARGRSRVGMVPDPRNERDDPMTKLSDTQAILLSAAAQRADGNLLPLPGSLRGGAAIKVVARCSPAASSARR